MANEIKVLIADDSAFLRMVLEDTLTKEKGFLIVGSAKNGKEAVDMVAALNPDIVILDCEMPVMTGLEALKIIMEKNPLPVLMFSAHTGEGAQTTIKALELGAVDFLLKPEAKTGGLAAAAPDLIHKLKTIVRMSRLSALRAKVSKSAAAVARTMPKPAATEQKSVGSPFKKTGRRAVEIIAMGSSTGGVKAASFVVPKFGADTPPIVWVQHMPSGFTESFARRMNDLCALDVKEAKDGDVLKRGGCYLAPGGFQMEVKKEGAQYVLRMTPNVRVKGHCPSCDVLFKTVSDLFGDRALGIILTGMGDDGTEGLTQMHGKGAYVVGQNEESCVVYGMPKAAFKAGAVDIELHINEITDHVKTVVGG
jgi:two-component system chemotaxis response regulator CheB